MKPILVTGGAGFIGSNFIHGLVAAGHPCLTLDALTYAGNLANLEGLAGSAAHCFVEGSINDRVLVSSLLSEHRPAAVVNFAAETHVDRSVEAPQDFVRTNVDGAFTLLEATQTYWDGLGGTERERFRFLQISTDEVFGSVEAGRATEDHAYTPNSPYAASKAAADHLVRAYNRTYGLPTLVTICGNNYGPRQFPEKLIPLMILNGLEGRPLPVYGDGRNVRDWIHVGDHCAALRQVLELGQPGETYNISGAGEDTDEHGNITVVKAICAILDELAPARNARPHADLIAFVADRPGHDRRYALDASKIRRHLGWRPGARFEDGLRRTVRWYLDNRPWWEAIRADAYRGARLGLGGRAASAP